ncbi:DUF3040 domain-containing protein [Leucobacter weissii]|uniref:DUF3040 domain-containing protein n=1 Tax=Leucobacter weissii TaxID=1983706 RepID=A0A939MP40_9MICO|nr:DUF3040 domain-containing protein [Leucobacter weissii]MBO1902016.1 DUF3040 domain-containing protein [Leucobacter weissii]
MGLSEREQQLLDDMERRLYQSEADVMRAASNPTRRVSIRSLVLGILCGVVGIGVLLTAVSAQQWWLGLIGFVAMLGGAVLAFTKTEAPGVSDGEARRPSASGPSASESFSDRMERRWDQRIEGER